MRGMLLRELSGKVSLRRWCEKKPAMKNTDGRAFQSGEPKMPKAGKDLGCWETRKEANGKNTGFDEDITKETHFDVYCGRILSIHIFIL